MSKKRKFSDTIASRLGKASLVERLNIVGFPAAACYFMSMCIYPWFAAHGNWIQVQDVWERWQSLNVGVLAFVSSLIAFNISRFNERKQREREFLAAKAFLPESFSELISYFKNSAAVFIKGWEAKSASEFKPEIPTLPVGYRSVFSECIKHAEPHVGDYLATILVDLQVHDARLHDFVKQFNDREFFNPDQHNIISYLYCLGKLQALINKMFGYARNTEAFDDSEFDWEDFRNAYMNLDIWTEEFYIDERVNLESFTKRAIEREKG